MTNTQKFFETIKAFRTNLWKIDEKYKPEYDHINKFKDSEHYAASKSILDERRRKQVEGLRRETQERIKAIVDDMEMVYMTRPSSAPSPDQLRLLETLKMREHIGKDELRAAANSLKGCTTGEHVLEEVARRNGHPMVLSQELSGDEVRQHLQSTRNNANYMISKLEHLDDDSHRESLNNGEFMLFRLNVDPLDVSDCMRIFGNVTNFAAFSAAVDGEPTAKGE